MRDRRRFGAIWAMSGSPVELWVKSATWIRRLGRCRDRRDTARLPRNGQLAGLPFLDALARDARADPSGARPAVLKVAQRPNGRRAPRTPTLSVVSDRATRGSPTTRPERPMIEIVRSIQRNMKRWRDGAVQRSVTGTPQGGVMSPLLANVYLDRLD